MENRKSAIKNTSFFLCRTVNSSYPEEGHTSCLLLKSSSQFQSRNMKPVDLSLIYVKNRIICLASERVRNMIKRVT